MKLLFCLFLLLADRRHRVESCDGELVTTFKQEILIKHNYQLLHLSIDRTDEILYFNHGPTGDKLGFINMKTGRFKDLMENSRSPAVRPDSHTVYIVGDGIHNYDPISDKIEYVGAKNIAIESIYFKNGLYIIEQNTFRLHRLVNGKLHAIKKLKDVEVRYVAIDNDGTFFFFNEELKSLAKGEDMVTYKGTNTTNLNNKMTIKDLAVDINGNIYVCTSSGIFRVDKWKHELNNGHHKGPCYGLDFDKDNNMVYSAGDRIVRLRHKSKCIVVE